jgi:hypothetical protein
MRPVLAFACVTLAACSTTQVASPETQYPPAYNGIASADEEAPRRAQAAPEPMRYSTRTTEAPQAAPPPPSSPPSGRVAQAPRPQPEERPGLGTVWGEERTSRVHEVEFERAPAAPTVTSLYYNDRVGIEAMAGYAVRNVAATYDAPVAMAGGVTAALVDEGGAALEAISVGGRVHVIGEVGRRYSVVLTNRTPRRFEVVASVDGLDVIDGRPAALDKRGYILAPWGTLTIDGYRRDNDRVAAFRFGSVRGSYAARTVGDRNVGVIGIALFGERGVDITDEEIERRRNAQPFDDRFAQPPPF